MGRAFSRSSLARRLRRLRGIIVQMAAELLKHETGIDLLVVPFKGGQPATLALLSGEVDMIVNDLTGLKSNLASGKPLGLIEGGGVMTGQIVAVLATWVLSIVATFIILMIVDAVIGLRVTPQEETLGLDVSQHEEEGYIFV